MIADLCLVLLLDASGSIDAKEWDLQAKATADAISNQAIVERFTQGPNGRVAVMAMEWASQPMKIMDWTPIANMGDAEAAAGKIKMHERQQSGATAVGDALAGAALQLNGGPDCVRHVVDLSSDGTNNAGSDPKAAVAQLQGIGAIVNALVIEDEAGVLDYYKQTVSGFVMPASWENYAQAIRTKLQLEVAGLD